MLCSVGDSLATFSINNGSGSYSWTFSGGTPSSASGNGPHNVVYSTPGTYQVTISNPADPNLNGKQLTVIVGNPPTVIFLPSDTLFCNTDSPFLIDGAAPGGGYFTGPGIAGNTFDPAIAGVGTHTITYYYQNGSCLDSATQTFTVMGTPNTQIAAQGSPILFNGQLTYSRCVPSSSVFNFYTTTNSSQYTSYELDFGDGSPVQTGTTFPTPAVSHSYGGIGIYKVALTLYGANGCPSTDTLTIFYGSNPSVGLSITGNNIKCLPRDSSGITFWFPITNYKNNPPGTIYEVQVNDGSPVKIFNHPPPDSISHTFFEPSCGYTTANFNDAFEVKITAKTPCVPHSVATVEPILISDPPTADFEVAPRVCIGNPVLVDDQSWGSQNALTGCDTNVILVWEISPSTYTVNNGYMGSMNGDPNPSNWFSGTEQLEVIFQKTGFYTVRQYVGNQAGCEVDTLERIVCVDSIPDPNFAVDRDTFCAPDTVNAYYINNLISFCDTTTLEWSVTPEDGSTILSGLTDSTFQAYFYKSGDYTITVTSGNHCDTSTFSRIIRVQNAPTLQMPGDASFCGVQTIDFSQAGFAPTKYDSLAPLSYQWDIAPSTGWNYVNSTSSTSEFPQVEFNTLGTYTIIHTITNVCGQDVDTMEITFWEIPQLDSIQDTLLCYGSDFGYTATVQGGHAPYTWEWWSSASGQQVGSSDSVFISNLTSTTTLTVIVQDSIGCSDTTSFFIDLTPPLTVDAGNNQLICYTDTTSLAATIAGGYPPYTIAWSPAYNLNDSTSLTPTRYPDSTSTLYTVTVTDSIGCTATDTVRVNVYPVIDLDAGPDFTLCLDSILFPLTSQSHNGGVWSGTGVTGNDFDPIVAGLGTHTLYYDYVDAGGCIYADSLEVTVINVPEAKFELSNYASCTPFQADAYDSSTTGVSHFWYVNGTLASTVSNPQFNFVNHSNTNDMVLTIKLVIEAGSGCKDSVSKTVTIYPAPDADFSIPTGICANDTISSTQLSVYKDSATYQWFAPAGVTITNDTIAEPNFIFPDNQSGTDSIYTITLVVTSADGCIDTTTQDITIYSRPTAAFSLPANGCAPLAISPLDSSAGPSLSYSWSVSPSVTINNGNSASPVFNFPPVALDSATYTIYLQVTDANGCIDTTQQTYTVYPEPTAGFTPSVNDSCGPMTVTFNNLSTSNISNQFLKDLTFAWDFGNGQTSTDSIPSATFTNSGVQDTNYFVNLVVANSFGCVDSITDTITVHPDPRAELNYAYTAGCAPFTIDTSVVKAVEYPFANQDYIWQVTDLSGNILGTDSGLYNLSYIVILDADSVIVRLITTSLFGCKNDTTETMFYTIENPVPGFAMAPDSSCSPLTVSITDTSTFGVTRDWYLNDSLFSTALNPSFTAYNLSHTQDSTLAVKLVIMAGTGCRDSVTQYVTVFPRPLADFNIAASSCPNDTLVATNASVGKAGLSYIWRVNSPAVWISDSTDANPSFGFKDNQSGTDSTYTITLITTSVDGCSDTVTKTVTIYARPIAAFSTPAAACSPTSLNLTDSSSGNNRQYQWSISPAVAGSGTQTSAPQWNVPVSLNDSVVYTINLLLTDSITGCVDTATKTYTVYPKPTADFTASVQDTCSPYQLKVSNLSATNQAGMDQSTMNFLWNLGNGQTSTDSVPTTSYVNNGTTDTTYIITLIASNAFGCSDTITDSITIHPDPVADISFNSAVACAPFVIDSSVVNAVSYSSANSQYIWRVLDMQGNMLTTFNGINAVNHTITNAADSVILELAAISPFGCKTDTATQLFYTIENPVAKFTPLPAEACTPATIQVLDSSSTGANKNWYVNGQFFTSGNNPVFNFNNLSLTADSIISIKVVVEAGTGCKDSVEHQVTIFPKPVADFNVINSSCPRDSISVTNNSIGKSPVSYSWSISSPAVWISDTTAFEPTFYFPDNQGGTDSTYTITLLTSTADGCTDTISRDITIFARPLASFSLPANACSPQAIAPVDSSSGNNISYSWTISPAVSASGLTTANPQFNLPLSTNDSVQYRIALTLTDANGCTDSSIQYYTVYPKPEANFTMSSKDSCGPFTVNFVNLSSPNQSGMSRADMTFFWDFNNGQTSTDSVPTVTFQNNGLNDTTYIVSLIASNPFGCSDTIIDSITVHPDPVISYTLSTQADCAPFTIDSTIISHTHHAGANSNYSWEIVDGNTGNVLQSFTSAGSINYSLPAPGDSVILRGVAFSLYGCKIDTSETLLYALGNSFPGFMASTYEGCNPLTVNFTDTVPGFTTWSWLIDGQQFSTQQNPSYTFTNTSFTQDSIFEVQMIAMSGVGCTDTITQYITVFAEINADFTTAPNCMGDSTYFTNNTQSIDTIVSWAWDFGDGSVDSTENPSHRYLQPGVYPISMTATNVHGCTATALDTVTIYPRPVAGFIASSACGQDTLCKDQSFVLSDTSHLATLGGNITAWSWDINADGTIEYTTQNPTHTFAAIGNYPIRLIVTSQYGCTDTVVRNVEVNEIPVAYFTIDSATGCGPVTTTVTDSSFGNIETHAWEVYTKTPNGTKTTIFTSNQPNPGVLPTFLPKYTADTTYYISYTVANCCGSYTHTDSLVLTSIPIASMFPSVTQGCNPLPVTFQLDGPVSGQPEYLVLDYGDGNVDTLYQFLQITPTGDSTWIWGQPTHTFNNPNVQDTTYTVTLTTINKCGDSSVTADILVYPTNAQAFINATPAQGCGPLTVTFKDASYGGINTSWCLDYDTATGICNQPTALGDSIVYTYTTPGTYVVAQFVNDGCSLDTAFKTITVYPSPTANFTHTTPACQSGSVSFTDQSTTGGPGINGYYWDFGDGHTSFLQNPVHQYQGSGNFTACLVIMTGNGCMDSICKTITIYDKPNVHFSTENACLNEQPIAFFDSTTVNSGQIVGTLWKFGDGNTSVSRNPQHTYANPGLYTVTLIQTSSYGCIDSASQIVNIFPTATANFEVGRSFGKGCGAPQQRAFTNLSVNAAGYYWDFDYYGNRGQHTSTLVNPSFTFTKEGVFTIFMIATNSNGCSDTMTREVIIRPYPKAGFAGNNFEGCAPLTVDFTDTSVYNFTGPGGIVDWYWNFGDGTVITGTPNVTHSYEVPGTYSVTLMVENDGGCIDTITLDNYIHVLPTPIAAFEAQKLDAKTYRFKNNTKYVNGSTTFEWHFGDGHISYEREPEHRYNVNLLETDHEFEVCLYTKNAEGCGDTLCTPLSMQGYQLFTPNAFAPDLAGAGDARFFLPTGHSMKTYHLYIFDEWGNIIFESTSLDESGIPNEPWNGTHMVHGTELPMGAYVWKIDAEFTDGTIWEGELYGKKRKNYGTVTLIR